MDLIDVPIRALVNVADEMRCFNIVMRTEDILPRRKVVSIAVVTSVFLINALQSFAVLPFDISTNNSGQISGASWSGNGTVQANLDAGNFLTGGINKDVLVQDFSAGTFTIDAGSIYPTNRVSSDFGATISFALTGGTADLQVVNSINYDGGNEMYNSFGLTGFAGNVTQISMTMSYTQPIASRRDIATTVLNGLPIGGALGLVSAGSGLSPNDFNVSMAFGGVHPAPTASGQFVVGLPANANPLASLGWANRNEAGATTFLSNGFTGLIQTLGQTSEHFLLVRGYDYSGGNNFVTATDADLLYIYSMTWNISLDGGAAFAAGTEFTVSMDGQQHANFSNVPPVPEPSSAFFVGAAGILLIVGRRRRMGRA
ncbi:hypothetical protein FEM03_17635 [Phragmitibacter flavus]|uniref:Uncharacterized protein n=1 Tax=Phragmitibacter flavus TaxID=2576071 RepID=A0A5R8KAX4_9BACT|nr:hypothetical protein [Phragmitibacter flavus]TLD69464.1 hypothetical protein FEM03_17635 [Phragmitibacter flavus]